MQRGGPLSAENFVATAMLVFAHGNFPHTRAAFCGLPKHRVLLRYD
jgi:hypothetical protein